VVVRGGGILPSLLFPARLPGGVAGRIGLGDGKRRRQKAVQDVAGCGMADSIEKSVVTLRQLLAEVW